MTQRRENDAYYTPDNVASKCLERLLSIYATRSNALFLEPSCGDGSFVQALNAENFGMRSWKIHACDINPEAKGLDLAQKKHIGDFLTYEPEKEYDFILGNPPYKNAMDHIVAALKKAEVVGFLLRLGFLASQSRKSFFMEHPPSYVLILSKRPSFTGDGKTDGSEYAFFIWERYYRFKPQIGWI